MAKSKTKWKIEVIIIELILIVGLLGLIFLKKVESYGFQSEATYFADGVDYIIPVGSTAKTDAKTKEVKIERPGDYPLEATGIPVYYNDSNKVVLMKDTAILKPTNGNVFAYRLSCFTELTLEANNRIVIQRDANEGIETGGILFDGENSYFFLEEELLEIGDKRISLPAFSYVYVIKNNYVEYFNYDTKETGIEGIDQIPVYARNINDSYRINLSTDVVCFNSNDVMLNGYVKSYKPYFEAQAE